jgi:hypothetical protein
MSDVDNLSELINTHKRRLQKLQQQEALSGISVDPKIPIEIENIETILQDLQTRLEEHSQTGTRSRKSGANKRKPTGNRPANKPSPPPRESRGGVTFHNSGAVTIEGDVIGGDKTVHGDS